MIKIETDKRTGVLRINDVVISGHVLNDLCAECAHPLIMDERYDAKFCAQCNTWLEKACSDSGCEYCSTRPRRPLPESAA